MKKLIAPLSACAVLFALCGCIGKPPAKTAAELYAAAVTDAKTAEAGEIFPLVTLTPESDMVTWNADGKALLLSWHHYPESYKAGEAFTCEYGEIWTFTDKEICEWYDKNAGGVTNWELRLQQLIGLPESANYTHVSAFWADLSEVARPAYQTDVTKQVTESLLDGSALGDLKEWFDGNAQYSYSEQTPYPWTRLGYTYDWADNGTEYGLTEFLILAGSVVEVEWTKSTGEFVAWLAAN